ncbi:MAG: hypothetical protein IPO92_10205 [Saprospiraceae bacterium]|nr:hypothetical protein [Saprospiraceae bacterium]
MVEQHIDEIELREKIISLFEYRLFPELMVMASSFPTSMKDQFTEHLISLQKAIYYLDAHLEAHWDVNEVTLDWHWKNISKYMVRLGIPFEKHQEYLNHIKKYEKHELELRQYKSPLRFDMEYFYFYKSCDVKLLRRLIYENFNLNGQAGSLADWRYYDLVTEVNDDVEDVFEDLDFINGNRFLISLHKWGKEKTNEMFKYFLMDIRDKAIKRHSTNGKSKFSDKILEMTMIRIKETMDLMKKNLNEVSYETLSTSKLLNYQMSIKNE